MLQVIADTLSDVDRRRKQYLPCKVAISLPYNTLLPLFGSAKGRINNRDRRYRVRRVSTRFSSDQTTLPNM